MQFRFIHVYHLDVWRNMTYRGFGDKDEEIKQICRTVRRWNKRIKPRGSCTANVWDQTCHTDVVRWNDGDVARDVFFFHVVRWCVGGNYKGMQSAQLFDHQGVETQRPCCIQSIISMVQASDVCNDEILNANTGNQYIYNPFQTIHFGSEAVSKSKSRHKHWCVWSTKISDISRSEYTLRGDIIWWKFHYQRGRKYEGTLDVRVQKWRWQWWS